MASSEVQALASLLSSALDGATITDLTRLSGGASRETWRFAADGLPRVTQLQRTGDTRDMLVEAAVVGAAHTGGVPVPEVHVAQRRHDGSAFMIVEAIDGETIARKIQRDEQFAGARARFAADCGAALAGVHQLDPSTVDGLADTDQVAFYTEALDDLGQPHPTFELVRNEPARRSFTATSVWATSSSTTTGCAP
jgi:aminoglycoside phosphotransferase (APT) family kinase protein